jgi:hypothetical protein
VERRLGLITLGVADVSRALGLFVALGSKLGGGSTTRPTTSPSSRPAV